MQIWQTKSGSVHVYKKGYEIMNIFQAVRIRRDIKKLYRFKEQEPFLSWNYSNFYQIRIPDVIVVEAHRCEKYISPDKFVPFNWWTSLIGTAGNYATIPLTFTITFNNNGMLPHAPMEPNYMIHGLAARLIYNTMKKEYLADWHKTLKKQHQERQK